MSGEGASESVLASLSLRVPEQMTSTARSEDLDSPQVMLEKTVEGVLAIETDTGSEGSGFFITPGCLVVTNAHVVEGSETIVLKNSSNRLLTAQVIAKDRGRDLALLALLHYIGCFAILAAQRELTSLQAIQLSNEQ